MVLDQDSFTSPRNPSPYELVFKATNDVLYDLDLTTGSVRWNDALRTQYGHVISAETHTIEWWVHHVHPDDALVVERKMSDWLEGQQSAWEAEYRFAKADGTYVYVRDRGYVLRAADGSPERIIGSFLDISHQKQLERAKDEFISLVSHQLRTPLSVIRTYGEMLTSGLFGDIGTEQRLQIERMTEASIKLIRLVSDILDISKIELDRITIRPIPTDINRLIDRSIGDVLPIAQKKGITILFVPDPAISLVAIDPMIFGQILYNFLSNSIKYSRQYHGHIDVAFSVSQTSYTLSVRDDGIGIPYAARDKIFQRFYRASNTANISESGTGLGLYLVKILADACGGTIRFKSLPAQHTTFYFMLPKHGMATSTPALA